MRKSETQGGRHHLLAGSNHLRDALDLEAGDTVRAVQVGDAIVLTPQRPDLDALRKQIQRLMKRQQVTADDLLRGL